MDKLNQSVAVIESGRLASGNLDELIRELGVKDVLPEDIFLYRWTPRFIQNLIKFLAVRDWRFSIYMLAMSPIFGICLLDLVLLVLLPPDQAATWGLACLMVAVLSMLPSAFFLNAYEAAAKRLVKDDNDKRYAIFQHCREVVKKYESQLLDPKNGQFPEMRMDLEKKLHEASSLVSRLEGSLAKCQSDPIREPEVRAALKRAVDSFDTLVEEQERIDQRMAVVQSCLVGMEKKIDDMDLDLAIADSIDKVNELEQSGALFIEDSNQRFYELAASLTEDIQKLNHAFGFEPGRFGDFKLTAMPGDSEFNLLAASIESDHINQTVEELIPTES